MTRVRRAVVLSVWLLAAGVPAAARAESGSDGMGANKTGRSGEDLVLLVPVGTIVRDFESRIQLKDLAHDKDRVRVAQGGRGGRGNSAFKSALNQAPRQFEPESRASSATSSSS